ncbi:IS66 family insertion sequence element accessory protein TnpA [Solidesulfovibrio magneticus]|uniref:Transposase orf1 n=1 Tax=Solidesulfovibrio magneticus (strain ATCC 700980 / DSM 13731 / RS-1) TaxID=573370 RepID=C4XQH6_SOLM1|nr:transposase [Solidesulfovibrio magneticus]BAH75341.1 putative transposase orf1 [Solidesulfovibrio magneticus RS-1]
MATSAAEGCSEKATYWTEHIAAWHKSGLSQGAYCRRHGLSQSSLSYWRKRLGATDDVGVASFVTIVPVPLLASTQADMLTAPEPLLVHVGDAFRIEIRGDFAAPVLEKLVRTLTRL